MYITCNSAASLAEEFEQLDEEKHGDSPPVVFHLQPQLDDEISLEPSPVHSLSPVEIWNNWAHLSPLHSSSSSCSETPYLESSIYYKQYPTSRVHLARSYRSHDHKVRRYQSHVQKHVSDDQDNRSYNQPSVRNSYARS